MKQKKGSKMKIAQKNLVKKQEIKNKAITKPGKPKKEQVLIVAQEIKFATLLSGNEKKTRDRALKALKKWLINCFQKGYEFKEGDFTRIWKGLFYAVWMSDKPLVQEELCESIAGLLDLFPAGQLHQALLLTKVGLKVLASEWFGIDHHRMDKYLMLVRRYLRASLRCLRRGAWRLAACEAYAAMLSADDGLLSPKTPLYARNATSMLLHFAECFLEELAKVSEGDIPESSVAALMHPFCVYVCCGAAPGVCCAARRLLTALLKQSEPALSYRHKTIAWEKMGCPEGGPDALELESDDGSADERDDGDDDGDEDEDDSAEKPLDPRAGRVNVELATLPVPCSQLAAALRSLLPTAPSQQAQRRARICLQRFEALSRSEYPLRVAAPPSPAERPPAPARAAAALSALEKKLASECDELTLRGLSRKHRKRVLARRRAGQSVVGDVTPPAPAPASSPPAPSATNGGWQVEETEPQPKRRTPDTSNKENINKIKKNKRKKEASERNVGAELAQKDETDKKRETKSKNETEDRQKQQDDTKVRQKQQQEYKKVKNKGLESNLENRESDNSKEKNRCDTSQSVIKDNLKKHQQKQPQSNENNKNFKQEKKNNKNKNVENTIFNGKNKFETPPSKSKNMQKLSQKMASNSENISLTPKKVKFVLKNNSMQGPVDYYKSVRQSPNIPFDCKKQPSKTNLKPSTPSPINPFFKKKMKSKN